MNFIKRLISRIEVFFSSSTLSTKSFFCGIGDTIIHENEIKVMKYPFKPSLAYPERMFSASEINAISTTFGICKVYIENDIIFISAEKKEELTEFAQRNNIELREHSWNWDWILEPYLDTELTEEGENRIRMALDKVGIDQMETDTIRKEVGKQMYKYNFDTMLWEWCSLGLYDVLSAMRVKYNETAFKTFYQRAIEIDKRRKETA